MAGITLAQAESRLTEYLTAEESILLSQRVVMNGKELTRADLASVQKGVEIWQARVTRLSRVGGLRVREVIPR
ncbi:MAG: hypothetical protein NT087_03190 [Deltaproteobacteria bacterium]|nr:hypothetical protein [Deltaproteobacteria bacterium]